MNKGVLLVAVGHPFYGNYALQMCRSIKFVSPETKVALAYSPSAITHFRNHSFDEMIVVPENYYKSNGLPDYLKTKVYLYELSPFQETIYCDSDVIWCPQKPISTLFDQFKSIPFTCSNRGRIEIEKAAEGFIHWAHPKDIMSNYAIIEGWLYNLASEMIYFKKDPQVHALFDIAKQVFERPMIDFKRFSYTMPDELAFEIACIKTGLYPHEVNFLPFYWEHFTRASLAPAEIYKNYYGYSIGGNTVDKQCAGIYNALAMHYNKQFGVQGHFPAQNKKSFLPERQSI